MIAERHFLQTSVILLRSSLGDMSRRIRIDWRTSTGRVFIVWATIKCPRRREERMNSYSMNVTVLLRSFPDGCPSIWPSDLCAVLSSSSTSTWMKEDAEVFLPDWANVNHLGEFRIYRFDLKHLPLLSNDDLNIRFFSKSLIACPSRFPLSNAGELSDFFVSVAVRLEMDGWFD